MESKRIASIDKKPNFHRTNVKKRLNTDRIAAKYAIRNPNAEEHIYSRCEKRKATPAKAQRRNSE